LNSKTQTILDGTQQQNSNTCAFCVLLVQDTSHNTNTKRPTQNTRLETQYRWPIRWCEVRCGGEKQEGRESRVSDAAYHKIYEVC
jgi:hypothetical protein